MKSTLIEGEVIDGALIIVGLISQNSVYEMDNIWCLPYDENSYNLSMVSINFSGYIKTILSNQYFPAFQTQAHQQLNNETEWNERSWALLQMFEYFNIAFGIKEFESNVKFISDKKTRKMFGSFRMWIDLERLYLLMFLKMDRIDFQEDRIFFCLYRTMCFLNELLAEYHVSDFKVEFLTEISANIKQHIAGLHRLLPTYMEPLLRNINCAIPNFTKKLPLLNFKEKEEMRKMAFRKLCRLYDMTPEIEQRLSHNIQFQTKRRQMMELTSITESPEIIKLTESAEFIHNAEMRIRKELERECDLRNINFDEEKFEELLANHKVKLKEKPVTENIYQSLMKVGHNPYDDRNYATYGEFLGVDINEKEELEKVEALPETKEIEADGNTLYYDESFIERIKEMQIDDIFVTNHDIRYRTTGEEKENGYLYQDNSTRLKNVNWSRDSLEQNSEIDFEEESARDGATNAFRNINLKKNLENNALFQRSDEEEKEKSLILLKKVLHKGLESNILFNFEKKKEKIFKEMSETQMVSIESKCVMDRNNFDSLRKVVQHNAILKKINKWINHNSNKLPSFYPRGIDEVRKFDVDSGVESRKMEIALEAMME